MASIEYDLKSFPLAKGFDNEVYHMRVKLPGFNASLNIFSGQHSAGKILNHVSKRAWSKEQHETLAAKHLKCAHAFEVLYNEKLDEASWATFGRPYSPFDYKISAIAREEYSEEHKEELRFMAHARTHHRDIAYAHLSAAYPRSALSRLRSMTEKVAEEEGMEPEVGQRRRP